MTHPLQDALFTAGPHPSLGAHADTYGRLIGSWQGEFSDLTPDGENTGPMEVHFGWALQGKAILDVWIAPTRAFRTTSAPASRDTYGTTLRIFDPAIEAWRILWFNPARGFLRSELIGRRIGDDIIQVGLLDQTPAKWNFTDISPTQFVWRAYALGDDGETWTLATEFRLRRTA